MKSAAIIIGCWEEHSHNLLIQECYHTINSTIMNNPDIETVWLSGNHVAVEMNDWYQTSNRIFFEEQGVDWIRRLWHMDKAESFATVADVIKLHDYSPRQQLIIWEGWQLEYLLNHEFKHIECLYYFGIGWNFGVKRDKIGWGQTCDLIKHNHIRPLKLATVKGCVLSNLETHNNFRKCDFATPDFTEHNWQVENNIIVKQDLNWS
jgi:hypothetical protein